MSQYLTAFAILLMVMSPPLIPAIVGVVHWIATGVGSIAHGRGTAPVPSLT